MSHSGRPLQLHDSLPLILSERAAEQCLRDVLPYRTPEASIRAAVTVGFAASVLARAELGGAGAADLPGRDLPVDLDLVASLLGMAPAEVAQAARHLTRAGVWDEVTAREGLRVRFRDEVCERSAVLDALDWDWVLHRVAGDPGAIGLARTYGRLLPPPYHAWTPVSLSEAGTRLRMSKGAVRRARDVLLEEEVIEERSVPGMSSEVRFSARARGLVSSTAREPAKQSSAPGETTPTAIAEGSKGCVVIVGGVSIQVPPSVEGRLEMLEGGGSRLHLGPLRIETAADGSQTAYYGGIRLGSVT